MKIFTEVLNKLELLSIKYNFSRIAKVGLCSLLIIAGVYFTSLYYGKRVNKITVTTVTKVIQEPQSMNDSVYNIILSLKIEYPHIVMAQAIVESANFTSKIAKSNNNLFGMKYPYQRNTLALDVRNGYARYSNIYDSVLDYSLFQTKYMNVKSEHEYYIKLGKNYAEDNNYIAKVKSIADKLKLNGFNN